MQKCPNCKADIRTDICPFCDAGKETPVKKPVKKPKAED